MILSNNPETFIPISTFGMKGKYNKRWVNFMGVRRSASHFIFYNDRNDLCYDTQQYKGNYLKGNGWSKG